MNTLHKLILFPLIVLLISACNAINAQSLTGNQVKSSSGKCPDKPTGSLNINKVETIQLGSQPVTKSAQVQAGQYLGYTFAAESGQKLNRETKENICIWVYAPDNQIITGKDLLQTGKYIIQVTAPQGSTAFDLKLSLELPATSDNTQDVSNSNSSASNNATPTVIPNSTISAPTPTSESNFSQEQALGLIQEWYTAKPQIFAEPFDISLANKLTTGKLYERIANPTDGSIAWLKANNSYYRFTRHEIQNVMEFSNSKKQPYVKVKILEELYFYDKDGKINKKHSGLFQRDFVYFFAQDENGTWKISDRAKIN